MLTERTSQGRALREILWRQSQQGPKGDAMDPEMSFDPFLMLPRTYLLVITNMHPLSGSKRWDLSEPNETRQPAQKTIYTENQKQEKNQAWSRKARISPI